MSLPAPINDDAGDLAAEVGADLRRALARHMDHVLRGWRTMLAHVEEKQRGYVPPGERDDLASLRDFTRYAIDAFERLGREGAGRLDHPAPEDLDWHQLLAEWRRDGNVHASRGSRGCDPPFTHRERARCR